MASDLPDDLLVDIFLRLEDTADLARASAACTSFRRIVSDARFLRRFRSLHRRPVLGLLISDRSETALFYAAQPPRRSAHAAAGFAKAADFSLAFLPDRSSRSVCDDHVGNFAFLLARRWSVCDVRDGRVLFRRRTVLGLFKDLVIYDPLHRRHAEIPTIPSDVTGNQQGGNKKSIMIFESPFLAPFIDEDDEDESLRFQVVCIAQSKTELVAFVFSSASRQWRRGTSIKNPTPSYDWTLWFRQHVYGCVCWLCNFPNVMLVFDTREIKFYICYLPHESNGMSKMKVEAGDGRLGLLLLDGHGCTTMDLYSKAPQGIQEPQEWRHDRSIPIIKGFHLRMLSGGVGEGYALLLGIPQDQYIRWICDHRKNPEEAHYFTLELKTSLVEKLCVLEYDEMCHSFLYASFPPPFSPPSVGICKKLSLSLPVSTTETCDGVYWSS